MNVLYLMEAYDKNVYEPPRLSNDGGFDYQEEGTYVCLLDSYSIEDEAIEFVVVLARDQSVSGFESVVLAISSVVSQRFMLHVRPNIYDSTAEGSFRLVNVEPAEVRVSKRHEAEHADVFGYVRSCRTITIYRAK